MHVLSFVEGRKVLCLVVNQQAFGVCELPYVGGNFELRVQAHHVASRLHAPVVVWYT